MWMFAKKTELNIFIFCRLATIKISNLMKCLENKFSREPCPEGIHIQISISSKVTCFPKRNKLNLTVDIDIFLLILSKPNVTQLNSKQL